MHSTRWLFAALAMLGGATATASPALAPPQGAAQLPLQADFIPSSSTLPSLADLLTRSKTARLLYDYTRDSSAVSTTLVSPGSTTLLAPNDKAILALVRKPHEGPASLTAAKANGEVSSNQEERQRAEYLERWVKAHVVLENVELEEGDWEGREYRTMDGEVVRFAASGEDGQGRKLLPGDIEVVGEELASNGKVLYIAGTLSLTD
ncbi:hypothetical protein JCM8097_001727 [Rhodosporidiobolus ruineniae]